MASINDIVSVNLDDAKVNLRLSSDAFDSEVEMLIDAARAEMARLGIDTSDSKELDPIVVHAIVCYCKANFGYDNADAAFFDKRFRQLCANLLNSKANECAVRGD